jgi:hypothetical protein
MGTAAFAEDQVRRRCASGLLIACRDRVLILAGYSEMLNHLIDGCESAGLHLRD